jgi:hypothetical protein
MNGHMTESMGKIARRVKGVKQAKPAVGTGAVATVGLVIPALSIHTMQIRIVGDSPLVTHAWSEKAKAMMLGKQMKQPKMAKEAKDPEEDFCNSLYWISPKPKGKLSRDSVKGGTFGVPVVAFKSAAVSACSSVDGITKVQARGAFHINGELTTILDPHTGKPAIPEMSEDMVRIAMGTADIRYRGKFDRWAVELSIRYNPSVLTPDQIANLFNVAGFACGVCEHRPECNGSWGMFHVE